MNENIDLTKILENCPEDTKFYSSIYGDVKITIIKGNKNYPITIFAADRSVGPLCRLSKNGKYNIQFDGECVLFPSKDQRDWNKFTAPWYKNKNEKFDPNTLNPFDKVLVRSEEVFNWNCSLFSNIDDSDSKYTFTCLGLCYKYCIPYNDDTKHLVGTTDEAPDFYRYWED